MDNATTAEIKLTITRQELFTLIVYLNRPVREPAPNPIDDWICKRWDKVGQLSGREQIAGLRDKIMREYAAAFMKKKRRRVRLDQ